MKIRSEDIAFDPGEMLNCDNCDKQNPPNRASCLYCSAALAAADGTAGALKLNLRPLENWENGFNIVSRPPVREPDIAAIARYLKLGPDIVADMTAARHPFPVVRLESETEAATAAAYLETLGLAAAIVKDVDLKIVKPNIRLRRLDFLDDALQFTLFNTGEQRLVRREDVALIVAGVIVESKTEAIEKRKKTERKVMSETATSSDDLLIDLYITGEPAGYRITTKGFDFSTLGTDKGLLAVENIRRLLQRLKEFAPAARSVDEFGERMNTLSLVWDVDRRTDFEGLKRTGVWKAGFANVVRTSNLEQFTKYSRLQRIML